MASASLGVWWPLKASRYSVDHGGAKCARPNGYGVGRAGESIGNSEQASEPDMIVIF